VFGPKPRNYSFKLNKKLKTVARVSALSQLAKDNKVALLESFSLETPKTKEFIAILNNIKSTGKTLIVIPTADQNIVLSGRNIPKVKVATASDLNTYDLLNAERVVLLEESVNIIENLLSNK
jgi:large subunit ribosomal protein L4